MPRGSAGSVDVTPSARRLTGSLRDIGYSFVGAVADLVDNSVAAGASQVDIELVFDGVDSYVLIADNGSGMSAEELTEALRFGTRREYAFGQLGRYGLGLKTASISQCRQLTVVSRRSRNVRRLALKTLDLDHIEQTDRWEIIDPLAAEPMHRALEWLNDTPGTVVFWQNLDRVLPDNRPEGGWARRRLETMAARTCDYLGMVFHRFIEGEAVVSDPLTITVNGEKVRPWNPFARFEEARETLSEQSFEVVVGDVVGTVTLNRYVLPPRHQFSSLAEFERMSGPLKWNRQQGLYIYRADRLIQGGGWSGIRAADEHTKFARASLDFQTDLDELFQINVAKMRVALPAELRTVLERPIQELAHRADTVYRRSGDERSRHRSAGAGDPGGSASEGVADFAQALAVAALDAGEHIAFERIMNRLKDLRPELVRSVGW